MRSASVDNRRIVSASHVTQLQKTKSADVHASSTKTSPKSAETRGETPSSLGATSLWKSSIKISDTACTHGRHSTPRHSMKCGESAAVRMDFPAPLPKS